MMSKSSPVFTGGRTSWGESLRNRTLGVFQRNRFKYVGGIFRPVGCALQNLVKFFKFNQLDGVFLVLEKVGDGLAAYPVGFIFQAIDFDAVRNYLLRLFQHCDCFAQGLGLLRQ